MSAKYPVIVVTGSSGSGTTTVKTSFQRIFKREKMKVAMVSGDSFHIHTRREFDQAVVQAELAGNNHFSHFGPEGNDFAELETLFKSYGETGAGRIRQYIHSRKEANSYSKRYSTKLNVGGFTPYEPIINDADMLFYEGLHGLVKTKDHNLAKHVDFGVGVVPVVNLEWIQKIHRDRKERGYSKHDVIETILRRMPDYVKYITPQFSLTDINFQRVATVDTSNPFIARDIPTLDESFVVIRFRNAAQFNIDFTYLQSMIHDSFMSRQNTLVVPGGKMGMAMEIIIQPILEDLIHRKKRLE